MIIVSQDHCYTTESMELVIAPEMDANGATGRYEILSHTEYTLGVYNSERTAKEVLRGIIKSYASLYTTHTMPKSNFMEDAYEV